MKTEEKLKEEIETAKKKAYRYDVTEDNVTGTIKDMENQKNSLKL